MSSYEDRIRRAGLNGLNNYRLALVAAGHAAHPDPVISRIAKRLEELVEKFERETEAAKLYRQEAASELAYLLAVKREIDDGATLPHNPSMRDIARDVCRRHGCTLEGLRGRRRHRAIVRARQDFCYLAYKRTNKSLPLIGRYLKRDHTTVLYSILQERQRRGEAK